MAANGQWRGTAGPASGSNASAIYAPLHSHQHLALSDQRASDDAGEAVVPMAAYLQEGMLQLSPVKSCVIYPCDGTIRLNGHSELHACICHHSDYSLLNRPLTRPQASNCVQ